MSTGRGAVCDMIWAVRTLTLCAAATFPFLANNACAQVAAPEEELPAQESRQLTRVTQPLRVTDITLESAQLTDRLPADDSTRLFEQAPESAMSQTRGWVATEYSWAPTGIAYHPLYFEQPGVERYGRTIWPCAQPILSAGCFYGAFLALPAQVAVHCPWSCNYAYGYAPAGTPACSSSR